MANVRVGDGQWSIGKRKLLESGIISNGKVALGTWNWRIRDRVRKMRMPYFPCMAATHPMHASGLCHVWGSFPYRRPHINIQDLLPSTITGDMEMVVATATTSLSPSWTVTRARFQPRTKLSSSSRVFKRAIGSTAMSSDASSIASTCIPSSGYADPTFTKTRVQLC